MNVQSNVEAAGSGVAVRQEKAPPREVVEQRSASASAEVQGGARANSGPAAGGSVNRQDAEVVAKRLEKVLNDSAQTQVQFSVSAEEGSGTNSLSLRVVDKETGEVVREFPSEEIRNLARREDFASGQGIFVDSPA